MCGIVGYVGPRHAAPIILDGLRRLEYRGYDSVGIATIADGAIGRRRTAGRVDALASLIEKSPLSGRIGIGHTRWATHGSPSEINAHPHIDCLGEIVVVHNGIVENHVGLRSELVASGHTFVSETDTEVIAHLVEEYAASGRDLFDSVHLAILRLQGAHGIVVMSSRAADVLVAARIGNAGGVIIGQRAGEKFIASDIPAILPYTPNMVFLEDGQIAMVSADEASFTTLEGTGFAPTTHHIPWDPKLATPEEYPHFMLKEIMEQGRSLAEAIQGRVDLRRCKVELPGLSIDATRLARVRRVIIVACGTSYHAGLVGKFLIEDLARLPVEVDYGSEFRYRDPLMDDSSLMVAITQSGETADTLSAMEIGRQRGALILTIVNALGSQASRMADGIIPMHAGPEIGVASTKAFTASLVALCLLGIQLGQFRGTLAALKARLLVDGLAQMPKLVGQVLASSDQCLRIAGLFYDRRDFLYLGRGINYPIALEGALKLKEISYIHAEGYPAGEMKHGPIALIDKDVPTVAIATRDHLYDKMLNQIEQVKSRNGPVVAISTEGDDGPRARADHLITIPAAHPLLTPILAVIPMQLLAYHLAVLRGCDVDRPRNLAKSVTVE